MKLRRLSSTLVLVSTSLALMAIILQQVQAGKMKKMMKDMMMMSMMGGKQKIIIPIPIPMKMGGSKCQYVPTPLSKNNLNMFPF